MLGKSDSAFVMFDDLLEPYFLSCFCFYYIFLVYGTVRKMVRITFVFRISNRDLTNRDRETRKIMKEMSPPQTNSRTASKQKPKKITQQKELKTRVNSRSSIWK